LQKWSDSKEQTEDDYAAEKKWHYTPFSINSRCTVISEAKVQKRIKGITQETSARANYEK